MNYTDQAQGLFRPTAPQKAQTPLSVPSTPTSQSRRFGKPDARPQKAWLSITTWNAVPSHHLLSRGLIPSLRFTATTFIPHYSSSRTA
jgi:hypothetical protein